LDWVGPELFQGGERVTWALGGREPFHFLGFTGSSLTYKRDWGNSQVATSLIWNGFGQGLQKHYFALSLNPVNLFSVGKTFGEDKLPYKGFKLLEVIFITVRNLPLKLGGQRTQFERG